MVSRMKAISYRPVALFLALALAMPVAAPALAQKPVDEKDAVRKVPIPYVPSPQSVVDAMLDMAKVTAEDFVIDLGSGDGRIPVTAARRGARGFGVDINPDLVKQATANAEKAGVADRVQFHVQDLFDTPLKDATVLSLYLPVAVNVKLRPRMLEELRPGTRIVAHQFALGDWDADFSETLNHRKIYMWIVPAPVEGTWEVTYGDRKFNLHLSQTYQKLIGTASIPPSASPAGGAPAQSGATPAPGAPPKVSTRRYFSTVDLLLRGPDLSFTVNFDGGEQRMFYGRVNGDKIEPRSVDGTSDVQVATGWKATRISPRPLPEGEPKEDDWWPLQ
jgi:SAM-dependent methyltransferase